MVATEERMAGHEIRARCRTADFTQQTSGLAPGYVQCNIVILPAGDAAYFESFCTLNPKPCPLLAVTAPGDPEPANVAPGADLRTDIPKYR